MKNKELLKCAILCFTALFLILHIADNCQAGQFTFVKGWGYKITIPRNIDKQGFAGPSGLAIDSSGTLYVADNQNHRIQEYDTDGNWLGILTECPDLIISDIRHCSDPGEIKGPTDVAVDPTGQYVYVVTGHWNMISKFSTTQAAPNNFILSWGFHPVQNNVVADFMREPAGVAVDEAGDVYVADIWGSVIWKFDSEGNLISMLTHPYLSGDDFRPTGIDLGKKGIYVTDYLNGLVYRFAYNGHLKESWGVEGTGIGEFTYPASLEVDDALETNSDDTIYVADTLNNRIQALNNGSWTAYNGGAGEGSIFRPFGVTTDSSGNVYVADTFNHRMLKYTYIP